LYQFPSSFSEKNNTEQFDRFIKDNTKNPNDRSKSGYDRSECKDNGKERFQYKVSGRNSIAAVSASAPAEKVREDGNLLPQGELAAAGLAETVLVSHGDRMSL